MATTQELLSQAQSQASALKESFANRAQNNSVPVSAMETASTPVDIPQVELDSGSSLEVADEAIAQGDARQQDAQAKAQAAEAAKTKFTESENELRSLMASESQKGADRARIEEEHGIDDRQRDVNETTLQVRQGTAALRAFDLKTIDDREKERQRMGALGGTKSQFGAADREFSLKKSIQRSHMASDLESLAAVGSYQAGDLKLAQSQADRALNSIYEPIEKQIENEKFFYSGIREDLTAAQKAAGDAQMGLIERQESANDAAKVLANQAVATGIATPDQVRMLTSPDISSDERTELASQILAKGSAQDRNLANQLKNAQIRSANRANKEKMDEFDPTRQKKLIDLAMMGDQKSLNELGYDPRELGSAERLAKFEADLAQVNLENEGMNGLIDNDKGLQASSGDIQSPLLSGLVTGSDGLLGKVPIVGNIAGSLESRHAKQTFLSEAKYIIEGQGFKKLIEFKEGGATFGSLSDPERIAIKNSASALASAAKWDEAGTTIVGFDVPEDVLRGYIKDIQKGLQDERDVLLKGSLPRADQDVLADTWGEGA